MKIWKHLRMKLLINVLLKAQWKRKDEQLQNYTSSFSMWGSEKILSWKNTKVYIQSLQIISYRAITPTYWVRKLAKQKKVCSQAYKV